MKLADMITEIWATVDHSFYQGMRKAVHEEYDDEYLRDVGAWTATMNEKGAHLVQELIPDKDLQSDDGDDDDDESVEL